MSGYITRRVVASVLVLFITSIFTFFLFFNGPTNAVEDLCQAHGACTDAKRHAIEHAMGFDKGFLYNYEQFIGGLVHDREIDYGATYHCDAPCLGISFHSRSEISKELVKYYPASFSLAIGCAFFELAIGVGLGILAALKRGTPWDRGIVAGTQIISSVPYPVFCLLAFIYLTLQYDIFPQTGYHPFTDNPVLWASGLLLPWLIMGIDGSPSYARYSRGQFLDAMGEDFVRTATAKGLSPRKVMGRHAMRAVVVPLVTIFGLDFSGLLTGTIFTEAIFHIHGIGVWTLEALKAPTDFPILNATILIYALFVVVGNLVVDLLYAVLDPRVRLV